MKHLGVLIYLALAASCGSGATRHRHETRSLPDESDYRDPIPDPDAFEDSQLYQRPVAFDNDDSVAADNIKSIFGASRHAQLKRPSSRSQARSRQSPWSSRTVVRRTQLPRAQQPCASAAAARPHSFYPPPFPSYGGYPTNPWWPSWGGFPVFPVLYVPVPVCNCSAQGDKGQSAQPTGINAPTRFGGDDVDYDDGIEPAPLDFNEASTPRPLGFKPPQVAHTPGDDGQEQAPVQEQVPERPPSTIGSNVQQNRMRCARAIVNCCEIQVGAKCFEIFGCEGGFFSDPCVLYDQALAALSNQGNRIK